MADILGLKNIARHIGVSSHGTVLNWHRKYDLPIWQRPATNRRYWTWALDPEMFLRWKAGASQRAKKEALAKVGKAPWPAGTIRTSQANHARQDLTRGIDSRLAHGQIPVETRTDATPISVTSTDSQ